ncbi:unnamed protein product [Rotaria sordida]|uniref:RING-type domain-containing protein n=1 Tax=Rotaria sordida TaxID=392033 RepID=A0A815ZHG2_9BILA|nr:unnamed protein product [Rotaria sordida]CAF1406673.1 unnamed protein product [Rotaria sordida]CAF1584680.1 unnamed protein product [Rotaria sordida]CAF4207408.1 unnamed protein product [Rotaria sordida]
MGLSTNRIVNNQSSPLEHLFCSICHEILWHPVTCGTCEHSFCEACLNQWFQRQQRCPNTCEYHQRTRVPYLLTQLLSQLKVTCKNTANGCTEIIPYEALEKHEQACGYEMKKCSGCLKSILKQDAEQHELQCDYVEILCMYCQAMYRRRDTHNTIECLRNQMKNQNDRFELKLTSLENDLKRQTELLNNIDQQQKALIERLDRQAREAEGKKCIR